MSLINFIEHVVLLCLSTLVSCLLCGERAGIACFAHIGGFLAGLALMGLYHFIRPRVDIYR